MSDNKRENKRGRVLDSPESVIKNLEKKNKMDTSAKIDQILATVTTLQSGQAQLALAIAKIQGDFHKLVERIEATETVVKNLQSANETLSADLNYLQQKELKQTFAIFGFPKGTTGENMFPAMKKSVCTSGCGNQ